jgi:hypothetical protein
MSDLEVLKAMLVKVSPEEVRELPVAKSSNWKLAVPTDTVLEIYTGNDDAVAKFYFLNGQLVDVQVWESNG